MKLMPAVRRWLSTPLVYLAALLLLLEDWLWDWGARLMARIAAWPPLHRLEDWLRRLRPGAALAVFALPALLLLPLKILALLALAHGHALLGISTIILAKLGGAAAVARLYLLTRPALLRIVWFAALLGWFLHHKAHWIARLQASAVWRQLHGHWLLRRLRGRRRARRD